MIQFPQDIIEMYRDFKPAYQKVYRIIKDSLFSDQVTLDAKFTEENISQALGVSRTPVRTALSRLRNEGILQNITKTNIGIREYSKKDKMDLLFLDEMLEGKAAYLAARRGISEEDLSTLLELNDAIASYLIADKSPTYMHMYGARDLHLQFHLMIAKLSGNRFMYKKIVELRNIMRMHKSDLPYQEGYKDKYSTTFAPLHHRIIEAIRCGNAEDAELFMRCDITSAKEAYWDSQIDINYSQIQLGKNPPQTQTAR